jgi:hypothetical protein
LKQPDFDFRIDAFFHVAKGEKQLSDKDGLIITLIGENGSNKVNISNVTIEGEKSDSIDFSALFKKPTEKYENLVFTVQSTGKEILIVNMDFVSSERQEVNLGETTYFKLNKGQTLNFKLLPEVSETSETRITHIFPSDESKFVPTLKECKTKLGCEFTL